MALVEVRGLTRTYTQGEITVQALRGIDLDVERGEFTALMGPSGSGKSTLLHLIGGLDAPTAGSVSIEGKDLASLDATTLSDLRRDRIGFVFQAYNLIPVLTAAENAELVLMLQGQPADVRRAAATRTLAQVGLQGLEGRRPNELSGGQQQRVAVARAIAGKPAVVLADEPTANLDSKTGQELVSLMATLNREHGVTFIFATHDPKVLDAATRVVRLVDGRIVEDSRR
jgi:putative ABC transport system ATP-binding protein